MTPKKILLEAIERGDHNGKEKADFTSSIGTTILNLTLEGVIPTQTFLAIYGEAKDLQESLLRRAEDLRHMNDSEQSSKINDLVMLEIPKARDGHA